MKVPQIYRRWAWWGWLGILHYSLQQILSAFPSFSNSYLTLIFTETWIIFWLICLSPSACAMVDWWLPNMMSINSIEYVFDDLLNFQTLNSRGLFRRRRDEWIEREWCPSCPLRIAIKLLVLFQDLKNVYIRPHKWCNPGAGHQAQCSRPISQLVRRNEAEQVQERRKFLRFDWFVVS
jgi:hypothetical protein